MICVWLTYGKRMYVDVEAVMGWLRVLGLLVAAVPAGAETLQPTPVAWFTDNVDRQPLAELRAIPEGELTEMQRAILVAANRVGWIENRECGRGLNGILISVDGRDGVLTSRHLLGGKVMGDMACPVGSASMFYPNLGYRAPVGGAALSDADMRLAIPLTGTPMNLHDTGLVMGPDEDWIIYWLDATLSDQPMPEGAFGEGLPRGAVAFAAMHPPGGEVAVIGFDGRFADENGWQFSWQPCRYLRGRWPNGGMLYHDCDVSPGASGSLMGALVEGELVLQGLVAGTMDMLSGTDVPTPGSPILWNLGTSSEPVQEALR